MKPKRSPPEEQVLVQNDWNIAAGEAMFASHNIGRKLAECIAAVKRSDPFLGVPLSDLKMHPAALRQNRGGVIELLRLLRERMLINQHFIGSQNLKPLLQELSDIVDFDESAEHGKPYRDRQSKAAKIRGEIISKDAALLAAKVKVEVDRIKETNRNISQLSLARNIGLILKKPTETIRSIIKTHGW